MRLEVWTDSREPITWFVDYAQSMEQVEEEIRKHGIQLNENHTRWKKMSCTQQAALLLKEPGVGLCTGEKTGR